MKQSTAAGFRSWLHTLRRSHPTQAEQLESGTVYLGVSGGADSLAMAFNARGLAKKEFPDARFHALIVDHQLQEGSAQVAETAARTCREIGLEATVLRIDVPGGPEADEAAARQSRYEALGKAAQGRPLLVAHTATDDAEGLLLGLARGSGSNSLAGLRPITAAPEKHPALTAGAAWLGRPLLANTRADTQHTCERAGINYWSDPHNSSARFLRSRVRHELLPAMAEVLGPGIADALSRSASLLREDADVLDALAREEYDRIRAVPTELDCSELAALPGAIRRRVIRLWLQHHAGPLTFEHLSRIDALVVDWAGQGGVSVPWHTMKDYEALGSTHAPQATPHPGAGQPHSATPVRRLTVFRRQGVLRLEVDEGQTSKRKNTKQKRKIDEHHD